jgi:hypothetical protein
MVFYFREKTTVYIWIPFFLFSSGVLNRREERKEETAIAITRKHAVSINPSIQNPLVMSPARDINDCLSVLRSAIAHFATR